MSLLRLAGVTRTVTLPDGQSLTILDGIDLSVGESDRVSIVGRSGSGKSTLLNLMGMIDAPTSGELEFEGRSVESFSSGQRDRVRGREIGFVFQQFNLLSGRSILENVMMPLLYASGKSFWQRTKIATEMLERVGLGARIHEKPEKLSGGEQQRVAIARALVRGPRIILADEPTGALDVETGAEVMDLIDEVAGMTGAALVTITHDPTIARRADRLYRLDHGVLNDFSETEVDQIHEVGAEVDGLVAQYSGPTQEVLVGSNPGGGVSLDLGLASESSGPSLPSEMGEEK